MLTTPEQAIGEMYRLEMACFSMANNCLDVRVVGLFIEKSWAEKCLIEFQSKVSLSSEKLVDISPPCGVVATSFDM